MPSLLRTCPNIELNELAQGYTEQALKIHDFKNLH